MALSSDEHDHPAKRRKVRKGTHSCWPCRRRKVKCVYAENAREGSSCLICERRGAQCVSQSDTPPDESIETTTTTPAPTRYDTSAGAATGSPFDGPNLNHNHNIHVNQRNTYSTSTAQPHPQVPPIRTDWDDNLSSISSALHRTLPCKTDIAILSQNASLVSALCYQSDYKAHSSATGWGTTPEQQIVIRSLLHPEKHPTLLARQMLIFAAALQYLSAKAIVPGLSEHQHVIMKRLADSAIKLANLDDTLLGSLEALENLIFEIFHHIDCGNIRRAWISARRAVSAAQMLALHRPQGQHRYFLINRESDLEPEAMWSTVVSMERMLSLLLGLPTSTESMSLAFGEISTSSSLGHNLSALVGTLSARILQRNQLESAPQALDMTNIIDREVIRAAEQMAPSFWRPLSFAQLAPDSVKALVETRRAFGHMVYYSMVVQLHLPYTISPQEASQRLYSRVACANASREILSRQIELRTFNPISACCRMSDFLALIAGMALMLGHIMSHCGKESDPLLGHQRLGDRATVQRALDCVDAVPEENEDLLAVRCANLLKHLLAIEGEAARKHSLRDSQSATQPNDATAQRQMLIMRVPYLGSVQISQQGVALIPKSADHAQNLPDQGVTIGGIGSMLIDRSPLQHGEQNYATPDTTFPTPSSRTDDPTQQHPQIHHPAVIPVNSHRQPDPMFPDAAASFDDWAFQGVDTAFIETLMRGSTIPLPEDFLNDEAWDIATFP